jgi:hypothetical protein
LETLEVPREGRDVIATAYWSSTLADLHSDAEGSFTTADLERPGGENDGMLGIETAAISPDGRFVYTGSTTTDSDMAVVAFRRDASGDGDPITTIYSGPGPAPTADRTPRFLFRSTRSGLDFRCSLDGQDPAPCPGSFAVSDPLPEGEHDLVVQAVDQDGREVGAPARRAFTVDTTAPTTTFIDQPHAHTKDNTPYFRYRANEEVMRFECSFDGAPAVDCTFEARFSSRGPVADGAHELRVWAIDRAGNRETPPAESRFVVDTVAPSLEISSPPLGRTRDASPDFTFDAEPGVSLECELDNLPRVPCEGGYTPPKPLSDGSHDLLVVAYDRAGNSASDREDFVVDTKGPGATFYEYPSSLTTDANPVVRFNSAPDAASFECRLDDRRFEPCAEGVDMQLGPLADGSHSFSVTGTDQLGNVDQAPKRISFVVDTTPPETTITSAPPRRTGMTTVGFQYTSSERYSYRCTFDGVSVSCGSSGYIARYLTPGMHTFTVAGVDRAGNRDPEPAVHAFEVVGAPDTSIEDGPRSVGNDATPTFRFAATDPEATFLCRLDGSAWAACAEEGVHTTGVLSDGPHRLEVRATAFGHSDSTPADSNFTIDTQVPETTFTAAPPSETTERSATFEFEASEPDVDFECAFDGQPVSCGSSYSVDGLDPGSHRFTVAAEDPAGNRESPPKVRGFSVIAPEEPEQPTDPKEPTNPEEPPTVPRDPEPAADTTPPETRLVNVKRGTVRKPKRLMRRIRFVVRSEPGATLLRAVDKRGWRPSPLRFVLNLDAGRAHRVRLAAVDAAGNRDPSPVVWRLHRSRNR